MSYPAYDPNSDPARKKRRALAGMPGTMDYPGQVSAFNSALYTPFDRQQRTPAAPVQTGPGSIVTPYGTASVRFQSPARTAAGMAGMFGAINPPTLGGLPGAQSGNLMSGAFVPPRPAMGGMGQMGGMPATQPGASLPAPAFDDEMGSGAVQPPAQSTAAMPPLGSAMDNGGNAMQRWQNSSGLRPMSDQRRYFWATGNIDARSRPANQENNIGATPGTFDAGGAHMPNRAVTAPAGGYSWEHPENYQTRRVVSSYSPY